MLKDNTVGCLLGSLLDPDSGDNDPLVSANVLQLSIECVDVANLHTSGVVLTLHKHQDPSTGYLDFV